MKFLQPALCLGLAVLLASCSSPRQTVVQKPGVGPISGPGVYNRTSRDGSPWWDVDVSKIPDAVPMPHQGSYKANPYEVMGKTYFPLQDARRYRASGVASWYGTKFHGQATANGETYDLYGMTAAHKTLPLPSFARVTNLDNGKSVVVRINDRGPFHPGRVIDLSYAAAVKLGYRRQGSARVRVEALSPEDARLPASNAVAGPDVAAPAAPAPAAPATGIDRLLADMPAPAPAGAPTPAAEAASGEEQVTLQVASFSDPQNAQRALTRLQGAAIARAWLRDADVGGRKIWRLQVGPVQATAMTELAARIVGLGFGHPQRVRD